MQSRCDMPLIYLPNCGSPIILVAVRAPAASRTRAGEAVMRIKSKHVLMFAAAIIGLFAGGLLAAIRGGHVTVTDLLGNGRQNSGAAVTPICNPTPVAGADLE